jgi:hypothetical protein
VNQIASARAKIFKEGTAKKPNIRIFMDSDTFLAIQNKEIAGANALAQARARWYCSRPIID